MMVAQLWILKTTEPRALKASTVWSVSYVSITLLLFKIYLFIFACGFTVRHFYCVWKVWLVGPEGQAVWLLQDPFKCDVQGLLEQTGPGKDSREKAIYKVISFKAYKHPSCVRRIILAEPGDQITKHTGKMRQRRKQELGCVWSWRWGVRGAGGQERI